MKDTSFLETHFSTRWSGAERAQETYGSNTLGVQRRIDGAIQPVSVEEIQRVVEWAGRTQTRLYTVSTGHNWGYGSATPIDDHCCVVDLSRMNRILHVDADLQTVTVEPGVTQQDLSDYLKKNSLPLLVPTTGSGPTASLLGNALEKGYGITPVEDHFGSILSLQAVLPDATIYRSTLHDFGGTVSDDLFKWKVGPYLDGLFAQSNMGIVTQATLALARRPERVEQFLGFVEESQFEQAVETIGQLKKKYGTLMGGINLMNNRRILSLLHTSSPWPQRTALDASALAVLARKNHVTPWVILGSFSGTTGVVKAMKSEIKADLNRVCCRTLFLNEAKLRFARFFTRAFPRWSVSQAVENAWEAFRILRGEPSRVAWPQAYLKSDTPYAADQFRPDQDGCGLIWFAPLVPIQGLAARTFIRTVETVCLAHEMDPIVTFIAISERCFDTVIPILFNKRRPEDTERAQRCVAALFEACQGQGLFPYRLGTDSMARYFSKRDVPAVDLYRKIKAAVDPQGIFSPGRYSAL